MSPLDQQLFVRKATFIDEDLQKLAPFAKLSQDQYIENMEAQQQVERLLERIVDRLIDLNYHIVKEISQQIPRDYHDSFIRLGKEQIVPQELAKKMAQSAGMRNILAHEYDEVDPKQIYLAISPVLTDVPQYLKCIIHKFASTP